MANDNQSQSTRTRTVVGVMTGTSIDGIDAALVRIEGTGLDLRATLLRHHADSLSTLAPSLRRAAEQVPMTAGEFAQLAWDFGTLHADVIGRLLGQLLGQDHADLICVHGQTIFHQPPVSWQLVNTAPIAARFNCPVVSDLRQMDLACGGQGAPITPIADWVLFRDPEKSRVVVNLGGFCNATVLPRGDGLEGIGGFDVCACNQVLDAAAREGLGKRFDMDGGAAMRGRAKPQAAGALFEVLSQQRTHRRSLGTGDEALGWVSTHLRSLSPEDLCASATDAIGRCIAEAIREHGCDEAVVSGGGARNRALISAIGRHAHLPIIPSNRLGVPVDGREAMEFAILGALCADGVSITLPQVTGCCSPAPVSGVLQSPGLVEYQSAGLQSPCGLTDHVSTQ